MLDELIEKKSGFDLTSKSALSNQDDTFTSRSYAAMLAKNDVPYSHKRVADNYIVIKRIYKFQAVQSRITQMEKELLAQYDFNTLEYTTAKQMNEELLLLQKWSSSVDAEQKADADRHKASGRPAARIPAAVSVGKRSIFRKKRGFCKSQNPRNLCLHFIFRCVIIGFAVT